MKRVLLFLLSLTLLTGLDAQVRVTDLATYTGDASEAWVMAVINSTSRKVLGKDLARGKIDSLTVSNDSAYVWKNNGTKSFAFMLTSKEKVILNQYLEKQNANAWINKIKADTLESTNTFLKFDSIKRARLNMVDNFQHNRVDPARVIIAAVNDSTVNESKTAIPFRSHQQWNNYPDLGVYMRWESPNTFSQHWYHKPKGNTIIQSSENNGNGVAFFNRYEKFGDSTNPSMRMASWSGHVRPAAVIQTMNEVAQNGGGNLGYLNDVGYTAIYTATRLHGNVKELGAVYGFYDYGLFPDNGGNSLKFYAGIFLHGNSSGNTAIIERPYGIYQYSPYDKNYFGGATRIGDTSYLNAGAHMFYVKGSSKFDGNVLGLGRTLLGASVADDGKSVLQVKGSPYFEIPTSDSLFINLNNTGGSYNQSNTRMIVSSDGQTRHTGSETPQHGAIFNIMGNHWLSGQNGYLLGMSTPTAGGNNGFAFYNYADGTAIIPRYMTWSTYNGNGYWHDLYFPDAGGTGYRLSVGNPTGGLLTTAANLFEVRNSNQSRFRISTTGDLWANGKTTTTFLTLTAQAPPTSSADASGSVGDTMLGTDGALYVKTATGWLKFTGVTF